MHGQVHPGQQPDADCFADQMAKHRDPVGLAKNSEFELNLKHMVNEIEERKRH